MESVYNYKRGSKKAQEEMFGFIFVIILVSFLVVGVLIFSFSREREPVSRENLRVNNLLNAMMFYTTECEEKSLADLIVACKESELICLLSGPCGISQENVERILKSSLGKEDYYFQAYFTGIGQNFSIVEVKKGTCPGNREALKANSIYSTDDGKIVVELYSCPFP